MFIQALLIGLWAGIAGIDQFNGLTHIHRPIVTGAVVGLILGDFTTGLIAGATLELVWAGMVPLAGAQPPNVVIGGIIGTAFAILSGQAPEVAVGIAVPFAVAGQALITLLFTAYSPIMHKMDTYAMEGNTKAIDRLNYMGPLFLFIFFFTISFLPIYFGAEQAAAIVGLLPAWLISGLGVAGGIMPAVGFAMLLKIMFKWSYAPFFAMGFVAAAYLNLPILAVAILAVAIAGYDYMSQGNTPKATPVVANGIDEEEDYSDGI
ncbi:PTS system, N-acetylgalactosamine-specific IIC component [Carnobacterium iners]|uniref:PTS system, N-acetylgalactosamine-specific IIC component n=1 Tax=Carnobacterium iners TaxID=1073423 RepID=A0A1X7NCG7_9LACT|nr:PTS N-acetylgalactosamine transporter subunit IIC [Carnobacterium iners]SEK53395.1 PTS system, N-acetylgalactosamine-specific IIC component [Carnobacterium iners]SMH34882.1 PTS system, N-acetylgalactosamine-specific IIC component [Carnobacterium iners]